MQLIKKTETNAFVDTQSSVPNTVAQSSAFVEEKKQPIKLVKDNDELNNQLLSYLESTKDVNVETLKTAFPALSEAQLNEIIVAYNQAKQVETETSPVEDNQETVVARAEANAKAVEETAKTKEQSAVIYQKYDQAETTDKATEQTTNSKTTEKEPLISMDRYLSSDFASQSKEEQFDEYFIAYLTKTDSEYTSKTGEEQKKYKNKAKKQFLNKVVSNVNLTDPTSATFAIERLNLLYLSDVKSLDELKSMNISEMDEKVFNNENKAKRIDQIYNECTSVLSDDDKKSCVDKDGTLNNEKLLNKVVEKLSKNSNNDVAKKELISQLATNLGIDASKLTAENLNHVKGQLVKILDVCSKNKISVGEFVTLSDDKKVEMMGEKAVSYSEVLKSEYEQQKKLYPNLDYATFLKTRSKESSQQLKAQRDDLIAKLPKTDEIKKLDEQYKNHEITAEEYQQRKYEIYSKDPDTKDAVEQIKELDHKAALQEQAETELFMYGIGYTAEEVENSNQSKKETLSSGIPATANTEERHALLAQRIDAYAQRIKNAKTPEEREKLERELVNAIDDDYADEYVHNLLGDDKYNKYTTKDQNVRMIASASSHGNGEVVGHALHSLKLKDNKLAEKATNYDDKIHAGQNAYTTDKINAFNGDEDLNNYQAAAMQENWTKDQRYDFHSYFGQVKNVSEASQSSFMTAFTQASSAEDQNYYSQHMQGFTAAAIEGASAANVDDSIKDQYQANIRNYVQNSSDFTAEEKARINTALKTGKISEETLSKTEVSSESKTGRTETKTENNQARTEQTTSSQQVGSHPQAAQTNTNKLSSQYQQVLASVTNQTTLDSLLDSLKKVSYSIEATNIKTASSTKSADVDKTEEVSSKDSEKTQTTKVDKKTVAEVVEKLVDKATVTETDEATNETKTRRIADIQKIYDFVLDKFGVDGVRILVEKCSSGSRSYMLKSIIGKLDDGMLSTLFVSADSNFKNVLFRSFNSKIYDLVTSNKIKFSELDKNDQREFLKNNMSSFSSAEAFIRYLKEMGDTANLSELIGIWNSINPGKKIKMGSNGPELYQYYTSNSIDHSQNVGSFGSNKGNFLLGKANKSMLTKLAKAEFEELNKNYNNYNYLA